jgi:hypothetical protein
MTKDGVGTGEEGQRESHCDQTQQETARWFGWAGLRRGGLELSLGAGQDGKGETVQRQIARIAEDSDHNDLPRLLNLIEIDEGNVMLPRRSHSAEWNFVA